MPTYDKMLEVMRLQMEAGRLSLEVAKYFPFSTITASDNSPMAWQPLLFGTVPLVNEDNEVAALR